MNLDRTATTSIQPIARAGLIAKGVVYCLLGLLACMAAFHISGVTAESTDKEGVFRMVYRQPGGQVMLGAIALGLACYTIWRFIQAFRDTEDKGSDAKGLATRARYAFSGLVYGSAAVQVVRMLIANAGKGGDNQQDLARELLGKPMGQWLVGGGAAILMIVGIYQIYYGLSEKYRKHVDRAGMGGNSRMLLTAGKIGYVSRGIVWLLIAWLLFKAAIHANASKAGDTSEAFSFLQDGAYGTIMMGAVGFGLICYGAFNFVRARYERF